MGNIFKGAITVAVLFFAVIVAYGLVKTAPLTERVAQNEIATSLRVIEAVKQRIQLEVISQGSVVPQKESELIPEVSGKVQWVSPSLVAGGYFSKGDILLKIDSSDHESTVARRQATLSRTQAEEELARFELQRMEELVKRKLTSQSSLETILRNHRIAISNLQDAKLALQEAKRELRRTEMNAPYNGLVRSEHVDLGLFITKGQSIASIYASESVEVRLPLADRQLAYLDLPLGHRGELGSELSPDVMLFTDYGGQHYEWIGKLVRTEAEIDSKSRMVTAIARVENNQQVGLPIGLFVNAKIQGRWVDDVVRLPRASLRNQNQVLIVDQENRLRYRSIEIMRFENDSVLISNGLQAGELVNVSPIQTVIDGMGVNPIFASADSTEAVDTQ